MNVTVHSRWGETVRPNQSIVKALVISFSVVVGHERGEYPKQVGFTEDDDLIQTFLLDRPDESLRVGIAVGCLKRRPYDADATVGQGPAECRAPFGVLIADEDPVATENAVIRGGQHAGDLAHECVIRMRSRSHEMNTARR